MPGVAVHDDIGIAGQNRYFPIGEPLRSPHDGMGEPPSAVVGGISGACLGNRKLVVVPPARIKARKK